MNKPSDATTGQIIARRRAALGYSQSSLARAANEQAGITGGQMWISRIESGASPLRLSHAAALAHILGCRIEDLLEDIDRPSEQNDIQVGVKLSIIALNELLAKLQN